MKNKFKQKEFGGVTKKEYKTVGKVIKDFYHKNPTAYLTTGTLAASGGNLALNASRRSQDKSYQEKQLKAMDRLTSALSKVDKTLEKKPEIVASSTSSKRKGDDSSPKLVKSMIKFRPKNFSILSSTVTGATIGANTGLLASPLFMFKKNKTTGSTPTQTTSKGKYSFEFTGLSNALLPVAAGTIVGAALGALVGGIKEIDKAISHKTTVDKRLMEKIVENLKKTGFEEGTDFTRDPKTADKIKSPVSIVITKNSGELRLLVNTIIDNKLKRLTSQITKNLPNSSAVTRREKNKYNEISITTISDGSADAGLITGICDQYIRNKYPVYLVEVG